MKIHFIFFLIFIFFSCQQGKKDKMNNLNLHKASNVDSVKDGNSTTGKSLDETKSNPSDEIYLKIEDWFSDSWQFSNKENADVRREVDTLSSGGYRITDYFVYEKYIPRRTGYIMNLKGTSTESSKAFGQWFVFHNDSRNIAVTGFYKNGLKDSIWITDYEDYPLPRLEFFKNGEPTAYEGDVIIKDEQGRLWFEGKALKIGDLPRNKIRIYRYDLKEIFEWQFDELRDSIIVEQRNYNLKNILIDSFNYKVAKEF